MKTLEVMAWGLLAFIVGFMAGFTIMSFIIM